MQEKKIYLASDHGGFELKKLLCHYLEEKGFSFCDMGTSDSKISVDYPDKAIDVIKSMKEDKDSVGVLICTTGIGMSIAANRANFIRAALVQNSDMALMSRRHNNANLLVLGAKYTTFENAKEYMDIFLRTEFEGGRHEIRVEKLSKIKDLI